MKNNAKAVFAEFALLMVAINIVSAISKFQLSSDGTHYISDHCTFNSQYFFMTAVDSLQECFNFCSGNYQSSWNDGKICTHFEYGWAESTGFCGLRSSNTTTNDLLVVATHPPPYLVKWSCVFMKGRLESETRLINKIPAVNSVQHWNIVQLYWNIYWTVGCSFQEALMQSAKITTIQVDKMEDCMRRCGSYQEDDGTYSCTHFFVSQSGNGYNCDLLKIPGGTDNIIFDKSKTTQSCGFVKNQTPVPNRSQQSTKF